MSIELDPPELGFRRPFTHEVTQVLKLSNPNKEAVAFKVKTTAPKQYCVRPNSGRIEAGSHVDVQVLLQAMKEDPPLDTRCRDKFLVQSVGINDEIGEGSIAAVWSSIEKSAKDSIKERKIRVSFLPAQSGDSTSTPQHAVNGTSYASDAPPPAYNTSSPFASPEPTPQRATTAPLEQAASISKDPVGAASAAGSTVVAAVSNTASSASDSLQQQLAAAKATIAQLQSQAVEGLRQRNVISSDNSETSAAATKDGRSSGSGATTTTTPAHESAQGVPVQIVAVLCLLSFLLAYFFF